MGRGAMVGVYGQGCLGVRSALGGMQEEMRGKGGRKGAPRGRELERDRQERLGWATRREPPPPGGGGLWREPRGTSRGVPSSPAVGSDEGSPRVVSGGAPFPRRGRAREGYVPMGRGEARREPRPSRRGFGVRVRAGGIPGGSGGSLCGQGAPTPPSLPHPHPRLPRRARALAGSFINPRAGCL